MTTVHLGLQRKPEIKIFSTIVREFAYQYASTRVPPHNLDMKIDMPDMFICNMLHPAVVVREPFFWSFVWISCHVRGSMQRERTYAGKTAPALYRLRVLFRRHSHDLGAGSFAESIH